MLRSRARLGQGRTTRFTGERPVRLETGLPALHVPRHCAPGHPRDPPGARPFSSGARVPVCPDRQQFRCRDTGLPPGSALGSLDQLNRPDLLPGPKESLRLQGPPHPRPLLKGLSVKTKWSVCLLAKAGVRAARAGLHGALGAVGSGGLTTAPDCFSRSALTTHGHWPAPLPRSDTSPQSVGRSCPLPLPGQQGGWRDSGLIG